jgi:7-carboxy-7-deazaguanine synthase
VSKDLIRITEIFYSLQGEANTIGIPTIFVRLTGCPLRCSYCDTAYAFNGGEKWTLDAVMERVASFSCRYVTVTGGEPLAQAGCNELLTRLADTGYCVSLETGGAMDVAGVDPRIIKVMDLKTPSSGETHRNLFGNIAYLNSDDQVKFVIGDAEDYSWAKSQLQQWNLAERCQILFSPVMGRQNPTRLAEWILNDRLPVRFQVQLHKLLWGDTPGK